MRILKKNHPTHSMQATRENIRKAIQDFSGSESLFDQGINFFKKLGYPTDRQVGLEEGDWESLLEQAGERRSRPDEEKALVPETKNVFLLFQMTERDLHQQLGLFEDPDGVDIRINSYLFFALELQKDHYARGKLAEATRQINRLFQMPVMVLFRHGERLSLAIIDRRPNKRDATRDVLEKVSMVRDIRIDAPHRGDLEILSDLALDSLKHHYRIEHFDQLQTAFRDILNISRLNQNFYRELSKWYFWARDTVEFPDDEIPDRDTRNALATIRLITRIVFVWFLKAKGLIPDYLFDYEFVRQKVKLEEDATGSAYYRAILQNLFFATLNAEKPRRRFVTSQHVITNLFRYERLFKIDKEEVLRLFEDIPFLNGGLFECLDRKDMHGKEIRVDGFSNNKRNDHRLTVPDALFFAGETSIDLSEVYNDRNSRNETTQGLLRILQRYKFTVEENTPLDEEIALDPELLGKVFENLLASYNPDTSATARKSTGSYYTPREVVNYMVEESLVEYFKTALMRDGRYLPDGMEPNSPEAWQALDGYSRRLRELVSNRYAHNPFGEDVHMNELLVRAIDQVKVLDPACGSGAFPMGVLHTLVRVLTKLDPDNKVWRQLQKDRALAETQEAWDQYQNQKAERRQRLQEIDETFERNLEDYGRKLYLIENCIYGVDVQEIAVQIAKLRFFISLVIDQKIDRNQDNDNIRSLPNLETRFVAANTLLPASEKGQLGIKTEEAHRLEAQLNKVREGHFLARTPETKKKRQQEDAELREALAAELEKTNLAPEVTRKLAHWNPYDQNHHAEFFDPEWMFGIREGFDILIANPPYVRQERLQAIKPKLKALGYRSFSNTADLFVYFVEKGMQLLRPGGVMTYIMSNKWMRANYGKPFRRWLAHWHIPRMVDFGDLPVFEATTYPIILQAQKRKAGARMEGVDLSPLSTHIRSRKQFEESFQSTLPDVVKEHARPVLRRYLGDDGWSLVDEDTQKLMAKLRQQGTPLGEYVGGKIYYGIKTGLNEAFVVDRPTRDRLIEEDPQSAEVLKPFLAGRDVKRYAVPDSGKFLILFPSGWTRETMGKKKTEAQYWQALQEHYPAITDFLSAYEKKARKRQDKGEFWWELRACSYYNEFEKPKILWPGISSQITAFGYDNKEKYGNDNTHLIVGMPLYVLGILNSSLIKLYLMNICDIVQGGFFRIKIDYVKTIPIFKGSNQIKNKIEAQVKARLAVTDATEAQQLEATIDALVMDLYGLTERERELVLKAQPS